MKRLTDITQGAGESLFLGSQIRSLCCRFKPAPRKLHFIDAVLLPACIALEMAFIKTNWYEKTNRETREGGNYPACTVSLQVWLFLERAQAKGINQNGWIWKL